MSPDEIHELAVFYSEPYKKLSSAVGKEQIQTHEDDPLFEGHTQGAIIKGLVEVLLEIKDMGRLPVVNFAAGGVATPADAAFMMHLGADGVFVGSGIFKSSNPAHYAKAIVEAVGNWQEAETIASVSKGLGEAMKGQEIDKLDEQLQTRGL
jgi:pyridoxal 5'-phosphate synthase pdxS subunit